MDPLIMPVDFHSSGLLRSINGIFFRIRFLSSVLSIFTTLESLDSSGASTTSTNITPETFIGGFELKLHPRIVGDKIKIAIENVISKLNKLDTIDLSTKDKDGNILNKRLIQLKDVSRRKFSQIVSIKDGEIAIIGGYIDSQDNSDKNGLPGTSGEDSFWDFATSAKTRSKKRKEVVITIKARIID